MNWENTRNNTNFAYSVTKYFNTLEKSKFYREHQNLIINYFKNFSVRGILLFHKMGYGKSLLAAGICESIGNEVIFIAAKTLHHNFESTVKKIPSGFHCKIKYVALNASNMWQQVETATLSPLEDMFKNRIKMRGTLNGKTVVVDEAHNLFNSIVNGATNATKLYKAIIKSNCRLIFLTGSPITNDPFEIMTCYNMLYGGQLLPENYRDFRDTFILKEGIKNQENFMNLITGFTSYYPPPDIIDENMPKELPIIVVKSIMSTMQYNYYLISRKREIELQMRKTKIRENNLQKIRSGNASYRVMSRQISNFCYPEYATEKIIDNEGKTGFNHNYEKLDHQEVVKNIGLYSPKMENLIKNILELEGIGIIYSQFLKYGLNILEILLKSRSIKYTVISGEIKKNIVSENLKIANSPENKDGELIKIILITSTGAEGVDFKNIRHIHILEPYWHISRILQIIGRGVRLNSHRLLPPEKQTVQPYIYLSSHGISGNLELTTDEYLYNKSTNNQKLINSFYNVIRRASIDCQIHNGKDCYTCFPTNKKIFDITNPQYNACKPMKIFTYNGKTYAEYINGDKIQYAELINGEFVKVDLDLGTR